AATLVSSAISSQPGNVLTLGPKLDPAGVDAVVHRWRRSWRSGSSSSSDVAVPDDQAPKNRQHRPAHDRHRETLPESLGAASILKGWSRWRELNRDLLITKSFSHRLNAPKSGQAHLRSRMLDSQSCSWVILTFDGVVAMR